MRRSTGPPDDLATEPSLEVADALDRVAVELEDDVADAQAGARGGTRLEQLHDLEAARPPDPRRHRLGQRARAADDPEEGPPDAPVDDQRLEDPARGVVDRHGQAEPDPGDRRVDPDDPATRVGQRAAGVAGIERGVGLDDVLDEAARPAVARAERPAERADHARRHGPREAERVADRDDQLADLSRAASPSGAAGRGAPPVVRTTARSDSGSRPTTSKGELGAVDERRGAAFCARPRRGPT